jgi:hypothetical protein
VLEFVFPAGAGGSYIVDVYGAINPNAPAGMTSSSVDAIGRLIFTGQGPDPVPLGIYIGAANDDLMSVTMTTLLGPSDSGEFIHWSGTVPVTKASGEMSLYVVYDDVSGTPTPYSLGIVTVSATQVVAPYRGKPGTRRSHFS